MKNTIENLLKERSKVHFQNYNYEMSFICIEEKNEMFRRQVIWRYRAPSIYDKPREVIDYRGEKRIDGSIWRWYNEKERRWVHGSPYEGKPED